MIYSRSAGPRNAKLRNTQPLNSVSVVFDSFCRLRCPSYKWQKGISLPMSIFFWCSPAAEANEYVALDNSREPQSITHY